MNLAVKVGRLLADIFLQLRIRNRRRHFEQSRRRFHWRNDYQMWESFTYSDVLNPNQYRTAGDFRKPIATEVSQ